MNFKNEYSNVYVTDMTDEVTEVVDNVMSSVLVNKVDYIDFTTVTFKHNILAAHIANMFIGQHKDVIAKHEYVVIRVRVDDRILAISVGSLNNGNINEYMWGILSK